MNQYIINSYSRLPVTFKKGSGVWLEDLDGVQYLDALCGISVTNLGHCHPKLVDTISQQANRLWHTSNLYEIENQKKLAEKLCEISKMQQVFFCNSGAEANETAIKIVRLYGHQKNVSNPGIIVFEGAFHGRTMATLTATANQNAKIGFEPLLEGFYQARTNDLNSVEQLLKQHNNIVGIFIEPVQGEGGINVMSAEFLQGLEKLCQQHNLLLMLDEIQCGMGRTGHWFSHFTSGIECDILTSAKALGNGFPIGACMVNNKATNLIQPGKHGTTFGGNPIATAVALRIIEIIEEENILQNVIKQSEYLSYQLNELCNIHPALISVKQQGLMIGLVVDKQEIDVAKIVLSALKNRLLINVTAGNVIRLLPPLIINQSIIDEMVNRLKITLDEL